MLNSAWYLPWLLAAMTAPVVHAASNCAWPAVLTVCALCFAVTKGLTWTGAPQACGRLIKGIQWLWLLPVISEFLHWIMYYWPDHGNYSVLPLTVLLLAAYTAARGSDRCARAGAVLLYFAGIMLAAVMVFSASNIRLENLNPTWDIQTAHLITVMLLPAMGSDLGKPGKYHWICAAAVAVSAITYGVLSGAWIRELEAPFYEMSRGIVGVGVTKRLESLAAAAMNLGFFVLMSYLLSIGAKKWGREQAAERGVWLTAALAACIFVSGMRINSRILAAGTVVIYVIFPYLKKLIKLENNA